MWCQAIATQPERYRDVAEHVVAIARGQPRERGRIAGDLQQLAEGVEGLAVCLGIGGGSRLRMARRSRGWRRVIATTRWAN